MIAPMKKVCILVLDSERKQALKDLRMLGLVHLEDKQAESKNLTELIALQSKIVLATSILDEVLTKKEKKQNRKSPSLSLGEKKRLDLIDEIIFLNERKKELISEIASISSTIEEYSGFGNFEPSDFAYLKEKNINLAIASAVNEQYASLFLEQKKTEDSEEYSDLTVLKLAQDKNTVTFLIVAGEEGIPAKIDTSITILPLPEKSIKAYKEDIDSIRKEILEIENKLRKYSAHIMELEAFSKINKKRIEFENFYSGMECADLNSENTGDKKLGLAWLTGFVPAVDLSKLKETASEKGWGLISDNPTEEDAVPTKLEGNLVTETIHPMFNFLNMFPGYFEIDVSWSVLLFLGLFTAMIFGDAVYGVLITLSCVFAIVKTKFSGKKIGQGLRLFTYFGVCMIIWGALTCSWFGLSSEYVPSFLKKLAVHNISSEATEGVRNASILYLSFTIGLIHLVLGHLVAIFSNKKTLKILSEIGAIMLVCGMYSVVLNIIVPAEHFPVQDLILPEFWVKICIGVGFLLSFVFGNYEGSIVGSIVESLKDIINQLLGVVNVFADVMSYIRLWAVGLAGASISMTVNSFAGPMFGKMALIVFGVLICVLGHGLNIILNVISVLVHGVRLNTMEFSGHAGLDWAGFKYKPFSETVE